MLRQVPASRTGRRGDFLGRRIAYSELSNCSRCSVLSKFIFAISCAHTRGFFLRADAVMQQFAQKDGMPAPDPAPCARRAGPGPEASEQFVIAEPWLSYGVALAEIEPIREASYAELVEISPAACCQRSLPVCRIGRSAASRCHLPSAPISAAGCGKGQ